MPARAAISANAASQLDDATGTGLGAAGSGGTAGATGLDVPAGVPGMADGHSTVGRRKAGDSDLMGSGWKVGADGADGADGAAKEAGHCGWYGGGVNWTAESGVTDGGGCGTSTWDGSASSGSTIPRLGRSGWASD